MPELPEVETIRRGLERTVVGRTIKSVEVRTPKIISIGHKVVSIKRRAKMLIIDLSGPLTILVHLKMTGQLIFTKKREQKSVKILNAENSRRETLPHQYTHVIFSFSDGSRLYYNDLRQFGYLRLVRDEDMEHVRELAEYGPEPRLAGLNPRSLRSAQYR